MDTDETAEYWICIDDTDMEHMLGNGILYAVEACGRDFFDVSFISFGKDYNEPVQKEAKIKQ